MTDTILQWILSTFGPSAIFILGIYYLVTKIDYIITTFVSQLINTYDKSIAEKNNTIERLDNERQMLLKFIMDLKK